MGMHHVKLCESAMTVEPAQFMNNFQHVKVKVVQYCCNRLYIISTLKVNSGAMDAHTLMENALIGSILIRRRAFAFVNRFANEKEKQ